MRRAAIVCPIRTAVGAFGGTLRPLPADQLAGAVLKALVARSGIDPARIDEVVMAQSYANSEAPCLGRYAALEAGLPVEIPGMTLDRRCGSGLQALIDAAMQVQTGAADVVVAAGVESMSNIEYYSTYMRWGAPAGSVASRTSSCACPVMSLRCSGFLRMGARFRRSTSTSPRIARSGVFTSPSTMSVLKTVLAA